MKQVSDTLSGVEKQGAEARNGVVKQVLEIRFSGWTATPRLPFILSGNALCMPVPSYSLVLGIIGCCLGRFVSPHEVNVGFHYAYDTVGKDLETRRRLKVERHVLKNHDKGSDAYAREFHTHPRLILWIDRVDWKEFFDNPVGTPALGRSQDLLHITSVEVKEVVPVESGTLNGCLIPYDAAHLVPGQLLQLAEAYEEDETCGQGRVPIRSSMFVALSYPVPVKMPNLYETREESPHCFYLHSFRESEERSET